MVNHYVLRLYISVDNPPRMTEIQCLQNLKHVVSNIVVSESWVQLSVVDIILIQKSFTKKKKIKSKCKNKVKLSQQKKKKKLKVNALNF